MTVLMTIYCHVNKKFVSKIICRFLISVVSVHPEGGQCQAFL